ncbi:MAG TPA: N-methyl-L-tryptophan oxidase [Bacillales bacterium]|nr:N-methyl-L-tryptophan oxidase [Bacillales bacterium]
MNGKNYDVIVIGAGTMGMAAGAFLSQQKADILLIDAFDPPHPSSSHHGETRMIRHAYGEGKQYVTLVKKAQVLWEELEQESDLPIFVKTGVLGMGAKGSPFLAETIEASQNHNLALDILTAEEIAERWPGISLPDDYIGCFERNSGFLYSENCILAYKKMALEYGTDLLRHSPVKSIETHDGAVKVRTKSGTYTAEKVIVTAGPWVKKLLHPLQLPIQPIRKVFAWFEAPQPLYHVTEAGFPSFYLDEGHQMFYGFPSLDNGGLKLGRTDGGQPISLADGPVPGFGAYPEDEGELREFLGKYMPEANGMLKKGKTCLQSRSSDGHFIIDRHPDNDNIIFAGGFSGHGFKFGSVLGQALSELALTGKSQHDLSLFSLSRFW